MHFAKQQWFKFTSLAVISIAWAVNDTIFPSRCLRTNDNILTLNEGIQALAAKYHDPYLDITASFTNENGRLPAGLTVDGLHLNEAGYAIWHDDIYTQVKS